MGTRRLLDRVRNYFKRYYWGFFFVSPWIIYFGVFLFYPLLMAFINSFLEFSLLQPEKATFSGFGNWWAVAVDPLFWRSVANVVYNQTLFIALSLIFGLGVAAMLHESRGASFMRTLYFIPVITSVTVALLIFDQLVEPYGFLQTILQQWGLIGEPVSWRMSDWMPMPVIALFSTWKWFGVQVIIFAGAISGISQEIWDASELDGANRIQKFFNITLPILKPQIVFVVTVNIINGLQMFTEVWVRSQDIEGGIHHAFLTPVLLLYGQAFHHDRMGYASSIGIFLALLIFLMTRIQMRLTDFEKEE